MDPISTFPCWPHCHICGKNVEEGRCIHFITHKEYMDIYGDKDENDV